MNSIAHQYAPPSANLLFSNCPDISPFDDRIIAISEKIIRIMNDFSKQNHDSKTSLEIEAKIGLVKPLT